MKLLDFGVAKHEGGTKPGEETRTGALIGSPFYMSPEQLMGEKGVDFRSDLWSLGVLAFEALTGERPFAGETVGALTMQVHAAERPRLTQKNPALPPAIDAWFAKACARDPAARFGGAKELADALAAALDQEAPRGIALTQSGSRRDRMGLADTAEAPLTGDRLRSGSSGGSGAREAVSAPPQISATGAGLSTTGGGRKDGAWRPMVAVAVVALGVGIVGSRLMGGRGGATTSPSAMVAGSASAAPGEPTPSGSIAIASIGAASADAGLSFPIASPSAPAVPKTPPLVLTSKHHPAPPASASSDARPTPSASATRQQGNDDDIR